MFGAVWWYELVIWGQEYHWPIIQPWEFFIGGQKPDLQYAAIQTKPKNLDEAIEQVEFKLSKLASKPTLAYKHNSRHQTISLFTPKDTEPANTQNTEPEQINPKTPTLPENHSKSRKMSPRGMLLVWSSLQPKQQV